MDAARAVLLAPQRTEWWCPNCWQRSVTTEPRPHTRFHSCSGLGGLSVPMVPAGTRATTRLCEPDDYVGAETVTTVPATGRPVMSYYIERDDGLDCAAYAHCATAFAG